MPANADTAQRQKNAIELPALYRFSVTAAELLAVIILAMIGANFIVLLIDKNTAPAISTDIEFEASLPHDVTNASDYTNLQTVDAFYPANRDIEPVQKALLPKSTLDVQIFGIRATGGGNGRVILQAQGGMQQLASIGNEIAANTTLTAVYPDRIEIRRNGRLETIFQDEDRVVSDLSSHSTENITDTKNDLAALIESLKLSPYRNGRSIEGFAIGGDADSTLLTLVGLQVADIITSVNGNELHSWERVSEIPDAAGSGQLILQLQRNGETVDLSIPTSSTGQ